MSELEIRVHRILLIFNRKILINEMLNFTLNLCYGIHVRARSEEDRQGHGCSGSARDRCNKVFIARIISRFRASP